jgi:integrase
MKHNALTTRLVQTAKGPSRYCDGMNLWLQVSKWGSKAWTFRYVVGGRTREMGLGSARIITLRLARELAREQHEILVRGGDPIEERRAKRERLREERAMRSTFKDDAAAYIEVHRPTWSNAKHRQQWPNTLRDYAYPTLGNRPTLSITGADITEALAPIWLSKAVTAGRVKKRIEAVCEWVRNGRPLPQQASKQVQHHKALAVESIPEFMAKLREQDSVAARALEVAVLAALRTSEVVGAKWSEVDLDQRVWTIPASRMKKRKPHIVPLSDRVVDILTQLPRTGPFVFPGTGKHHLSNNAMLKTLRAVSGDAEATVHGTARSCFSDWAKDRTNASHEVIEFALAHAIPSKTQAAYRRYSALEKRRALMEQWAAYCESSTMGANITQLRRA